ncbi:MAG: Glu-tRNA(Gln) amidotransferase subunit GatD [Nanoarchaeota archaeon]|nr:Glu-tRNA(Gln) amidotransferase subunit GatD [Nanoarchaeota archaeon]
MANPNDKVKIVTKRKTFIGLFLESPNKKTIVLKLESGYNLGINKKEIVSISVQKKSQKKQSKLKKINYKKNLKAISILHTGGTIASQVDYETGAVTAKFTPEDLISMFPELKEIGNIKSRLMRNMASDDMRFAHYNLMAEEIKKEIKSGANGIIITHGTDTMHYTSAALSFILHNLPVPVIVVGSQRSSDRGSSDAGINLVSAAKIIAETDFCDVALCMHKTLNDNNCLLLPSCKTRKMHTSRRDAFQPVNSTPWAEIGKKVKFLRNDYRQLEKDSKLEIKPIKENLKIGIVKAHPNMFAKELECYENFDGLVLEGTGLGHFPINVVDEFTKEHKKIYMKIKKLTKKMPIVMSPQTIFGRINMNVYAAGRKIKELGILGDYSDMTPETTLIKLAWLLSNDPKHLEERLKENIAGEMSKRIGLNFL